MGLPSILGDHIYHAVEAGLQLPLHLSQGQESCLSQNHASSSVTSVVGIVGFIFFFRVIKLPSPVILKLADFLSIFQSPANDPDREYRKCSASNDPGRVNVGICSCDDEARATRPDKHEEIRNVSRGQDLRSVCLTQWAILPARETIIQSHFFEAPQILFFDPTTQVCDR
jgi:hypothetical protein